jgi:hypothetical protein
VIFFFPDIPSRVSGWASPDIRTNLSN